MENKIVKRLKKEVKMYRQIAEEYEEKAELAEEQLAYIKKIRR